MFILSINAVLETEEQKVWQQGGLPIQKTFTTKNTFLGKLTNQENFSPQKSYAMQYGNY